MTRGHKRFGRYELVTEIGRGGMAELYLGRLLGLGGFAKPVAIKRILPHLTQDPRFVEMFLNEGRIAARLSHPNVCQVFELGEVDGELFLAMEYLEGVAWGELVGAVARDPVAILRLAAHVIGQACDGLSYAHELTDAQGRPTPVVHRDISPGNLYVTVDGVCKILDFGVSKIASEGHETRSGMIKGKLAYMPPEQMRGEDVDARVDVFAAGVCLWEALTGARLFVRENDYMMFKAILEDPIPRVASYDAALGHFAGAIDAVIGRALERDRDRRYPTIRAFAGELRAVAARYGGPLTAADIGNLVRTLFHRRLADRSRMVAAVSAVYERAPADKEPQASVTKSVQLRAGGSRAVERASRSHRGRWAIAIGVVALIAAASMIALRAGDDVHASVRTPPIADASVVQAVVADAAIATVPAVADEIVIEEPAGARGPASSIRPSLRPRRDPPALPTDAKKPGFYSVDSNPYATIFVDGTRQDQTPLFRIELAPGRHQIKAVLKDGRQRSFAVRIEPGRDVSSGTLSW